MSVYTTRDTAHISWNVRVASAGTIMYSYWSVAVSACVVLVGAPVVAAWLRVLRLVLFMPLVPVSACGKAIINNPGFTKHFFTPRMLDSRRVVVETVGTRHQRHDRCWDPIAKQCSNLDFGAILFISLID